MRFVFNSGQSQGATIERSGRPVLPPVRPPGGLAHPSSITGPVASATGGGTVLGATISVMYGDARIKGHLALAERYDEMLTLLWVLCSGECDIPLATVCRLNGEIVDSGGGSYLDYIVATSSAPGSVTQGGSIMPILDWLNTESGTTDYSFLYPGQTMFGARINTLKADMTSFNLEWDGNGRKFIDFRIPGNPITQHKNNVLIAHDILTSKWPWPGVLDDETNPLLNSDIYLDQWEEWADWCDNTSIQPYDYANKVLGTAVDISPQKRWEFNGIVKSTNPWTAANSVLAGAFLKLVSVNGRIMLRPETDVVPTSVYIPEGRFLGNVDINDADPNTIATEMTVAYIAAENYSECKVTYQRPSVAGEYVPLASTLYGSNSQKQSLRWAEQTAKIFRERWSVKFLAGTEVANVAPGDIIEACLPYGFGDTFVRVMAIIAKHDLGKYQISGRLVFDSVVSTEIGIGYSPENPDGGWSTGTPNTPASFSVTVSTRQTSNDTLQPIIMAEWTPPVSGPRVKYYELKQGTTILARVFGLKWTGPVVGGGLAYITVASVGYNGTESSPYQLGQFDFDVGHVNGIGGVAIDNSPTGGDDGGHYAFDEGVETLTLVRHKHNFELHEVEITGAATIAGGTIHAGDSDIASVTASVSDGLAYVSNYRAYIPTGSTTAFWVELDDPPGIGNSVTFNVWVGVTASLSALDETGGGAVPNDADQSDS